LILATSNGNKEIVQTLLDNGANVNAKNNSGMTALMDACASTTGMKEIVRALLDKGADVNAKDNGGQTALMFASSTGNKEIVRALLDKGADVNAKSNDGNTAMTFASDKTEVEELLIKAGAKPAAVSVSKKSNESVNTSLKYKCDDGTVFTYVEDGDTVRLMFAKSNTVEVLEDNHPPTGMAFSNENYDYQDRYGDIYITDHTKHDKKNSKYAYSMYLTNDNSNYWGSEPKPKTYSERLREWRKYSGSDVSKPLKKSDFSTTCHEIK
jgi:hypothetical protein